MSDKEIGLAPYHIPTVASGDYKIKASLTNDINSGKEQEVKFLVEGYNATIPQNEILAVYPPIDHTGNFAGTFPHIQFRRSTLPWEYKVDRTTKDEDRLPYIFLVLLRESEIETSEEKYEELNQEFEDIKAKIVADYEISKESISLEKLIKLKSSEENKKEEQGVDKDKKIKEIERLIFLIQTVVIFESDTNSLKDTTESPDEPKPLKILKGLDFCLFPNADVIQKLAHVRVQEHTELKDLNLPKETSILISHRMVEPNTKYHAFVCYYAEENSDKYEMIQDLNKISNTCVVLNEWSFESIGTELYQVDKKKLEKYPHKDKDRKLPDNYENSEIVALDLKNIEANRPFYPFKELIDKNLKYLEGRKKRWEDPNRSGTLDEFEKAEEGQPDNNHILEYLQYNGKNLKGYLHELVLKPFKTNQYNKLSNDSIQKLLNTAKVPLEHQLKAGGKMVSWYQGPFTNNKSNFDLLQLLTDQKFVTIPDHQDYLNLFNEETGMYDMTYSAAWQLGRLMIMNDNKVLQELKKWKYDLELYNLVEEQNKLSHLPNLSNQAPSIPDVLMNYVTELVQFRNFPLYYLLPHKDLSTEESIKYFKIDNAWILAFLFGIFSAGPKLSIKDFKCYVFERPKKDFEEAWEKLSIEGIDKSELIEILDNTLVIDKTNTAQKIVEFVNKCVLVFKDNDSIKYITDLILKLKNEMWYVFNSKKDYYGIILQSQTIKNWPHLVVELNKSHEFHYVTSINNSLRLYVTDTEISSVEMYLKNENAHFGKDYKRDDNQFIITDQDSVTTANNNLYKQPRVVFNID